MSDDSFFLRNPAVNATEIDEETFLVGPDDGEVYYLDEISSALWRLLETPQRREDIVKTFSAAFPDVPGADLAADIERALAGLVARGLASHFG